MIWINPINPEIPKWTPEASNGTHHPTQPQPSSRFLTPTTLSKPQRLHLNRAAPPQKDSVSGLGRRGARWAVVVAIAAARVTAVLGKVWGNGKEGDGSRLRKQECEESWRVCERRWIAKVGDWLGVSVCRLESLGTVEGNHTFNCCVLIVLLINFISCFFNCVVNFMFLLWLVSVDASVRML